MAIDPASEPSWQRSLDELEALPSLPVEERVEVVERLIRNPRPGIRERALRVGTAVLSDDTLVEYLRSDADAVVRNAGLEILKRKGSQSLSLAVNLLKDAEPDVALQAVLLIDHIGDPRGLEPLRAVLRHEDTNLVQAAMVAVGHLGDHRVIPDLLAFLTADLWLQMAAIQALGDLRNPEAIAPIAELLTDLMVGSTAAEAVAQIGGEEAFDVLSKHWLAFRSTLDPENSLGLLAHTLEGLAGEPEYPKDLRPALAEHLRDPYRGVRNSAARCLLALGPGPEDTEALSVLVSGYDESDVLPSCLNRRTDLAPALLAKPIPLNSWGFLLCAQSPAEAPVEALVSGIDALPAVQLPQPLLGGLERLHLEALGAPLLRLYLRTKPAERVRLLPALQANHEAVSRAVDDVDTLSANDHAVLMAILRKSTEATHRTLVELEPEARTEVLRLVLDQADLLRTLPWESWLTEEPDRYLDLAARAASNGGLAELLPHLREALAETPNAEAIRAVGNLGDRESVPVILPIFEREDSKTLRPIVIESLGKIGGTEAREALREIATGREGIDSRLAYHALAECASEEDDECFRQAAAHSDWYIRLAAVQALARFSRPENLRALSELAADPVSIVAERALTALRSQ
ncbi:MAG: HEAT repeat domain-containing protein [Thermoanaerobaculia bacterium]